MPVEEILQEVENIDQQAKQFKHDLFKLAWYMRGSMSTEETWFLGPEDREIVSGIIKDNLKITEKTGRDHF